ncbi:MAG: hypothetical protein IJI11_06255 [Mogibacterium sp.]|nr:hypothetical protein [Mogibacterium sp.]MBQ6315179.1 hypothetical protein [Mogibacterium sp.]
MRYIWNLIDRKNWIESSKFRIVVLGSAVISALLGLCIWSIVRLWALDHWSWMAIFTGYPAVIAVIVIITYSFNHSFHDGSFSRTARQ